MRRKAKSKRIQVERLENLAPPGLGCPIVRQELISYCLKNAPIFFVQKKTPVSVRESLIMLKSFLITKTASPARPDGSP